MTSMAPQRRFPWRRAKQEALEAVEEAKRARMSAARQSGAVRFIRDVLHDIHVRNGFAEQAKALISGDMNDGKSSH